ncbi:MAG: hypothetical protein QOF97_700 [Acidimicrobiaceae bacterium]
MLGLLEAAIDDLDVDTLACELPAAFALLDRLQAKLTMAAGTFDRAQRWELDAAGSMTAWLRTPAGRSHTDAPRVRATARRLHDLPGCSSAWMDGTLSSAQVGAVTANVTDRTVGLFAESEAVMVPALADCSERDAAELMRTWAAHANALFPDPHDKPQARRSLHHSEVLDGRSHLNADLDPEATAIVSSILRLFHRPNTEDETRGPAERRADALVDALRWTLDHQNTQTGGRHRPHLNIIINHDDLFSTGHGGGSTLDGTPLDHATVQRLLCDTAIHRILTNGRGVVLDFGTATRTISPALWTALVLRDRHCSFEHCDVASDRCDAHHVHHVEHGGPTNLSNLTLRCWHHHHLVHQPGWHEKVLPDGTIKTTSPTGKAFTSRPPP